MQDIVGWAWARCTCVFLVWKSLWVLQGQSSSHDVADIIWQANREYCAKLYAHCLRVYSISRHEKLHFDITPILRRFYSCNIAHTQTFTHMLHVTSHP